MKPKLLVNDSSSKANAISSPSTTFASPTMKKIQSAFHDYIGDASPEKEFEATPQHLRKKLLEDQVKFDSTYYNEMELNKKLKNSANFAKLKEREVYNLNCVNKELKMEVYQLEMAMHEQITERQDLLLENKKMREELKFLHEKLSSASNCYEELQKFKELYQAKEQENKILKKRIDTTAKDNSNLLMELKLLRIDYDQLQSKYSNSDEDIKERINPKNTCFADELISLKLTNKRLQQLLLQSKDFECFECIEKSYIPKNSEYEDVVNHFGGEESLTSWGVRVLSNTHKDRNSKVCLSKEFKNWIPTQALQLSYRFKFRHGNSIAINDIHKFLRKLNCVWHQHSRVLLKQSTKILYDEISSLRRQVKNRVPYDAVMHIKEIARLKNEILSLTSHRLHQQQYHKGEYLNNVNSSALSPTNYTSNKAFLEKKALPPNVRIPSTNQTDCFLNGVVWIGERMTQISDEYLAQWSSLIVDFRKKSTKFFHEEERGISLLQTLLHQFDQKMKKLMQEFRQNISETYEDSLASVDIIKQ